jgi:hypothetical protein
MSNSRITYAPRSDATPERELGALVRAYSFVLRNHRDTKAARTSGGEDARKEDHSWIGQRNRTAGPLN